MTRSRVDIVAYLWMGVLALVWGASYLFIKIAVRGGDMSPEVLSLIRSAVGGLTLAVILAVRGGAFRPSGLPRLLPAFLVMALFSAVLPWTAIAWGELHISSGLASILNATTPIWTAVLAFWVTPAERPRFLNYLGVLVAFVGTAMLVSPSLLRHGVSGDLLGALAVLAAAASYAVGSLFQRRRLSHVDSSQAAFWQITVAAVIMVPVSLPTVARTHLHVASTLAAVVLGVGASGAGYVIFYYLLNTLGATRYSTVVFLLPITAVLWGVLFLNEQVGPAMLGGMAVILAGVFLATVPAVRRPAIAAPAGDPSAVDAYQSHV